VRLAYEQGLLKQHSLNFYQKWALLYWVYMVRREQLEDKESELERQTFNLYPQRWNELYRDQMLAEMGLPNEHGEIPLMEDDLDELDRFMEQLERQNKFSMSGSSTPKDYQVRSHDWGNWT
jgi:hypothetical protein